MALLTSRHGAENTGAARPKWAMQISIGQTAAVSRHTFT